jgi:ABC-2 type transport system permease protein
MHRITAQVWKEWKQLWRDRLVMSLAVLMPIVMLMLFGTAIRMKLTDMPVFVQDLDQTTLSRRYIETWVAAVDFIVKPAQLGAPPSAALDAGNARAVIIIPPNFQRDYLRGANPQVQVLIDGTDANAATNLKNMARGLTQAFLLKQAGGTPTAGAVSLQSRLWYNPGRSDSLFFGSGALGLVLVLFPALLGALIVAREHELGTLVQVYASTLAAHQWLIGKAVPVIFIGLVELALCFVLGLMFFGYQVPSDPLPMLVASLLYMAAGVFYGMLLGNATGTQSAAIQGVQLGAFLISMLLSGFLVPLENIPVQLRWVSHIVPATHYIKVVRNSILRDVGWDASGRAILMLLVLAVVFFMANMGRMRRMQFR